MDPFMYSSGAGWPAPDPFGMAQQFVPYDTQPYNGMYGGMAGMGMGGYEDHYAMAMQHQPAFSSFASPMVHDPYAGAQHFMPAQAPMPQMPPPPMGMGGMGGQHSGGNPTLCAHTRGDQQCQGVPLPGRPYCVQHTCSRCFGHKPSNADICPTCAERAQGPIGGAAAPATVAPMGGPVGADQCARVGPQGKCTYPRAHPSMYCGMHACPVCGQPKSREAAGCQMHPTGGPGNPSMAPPPLPPNDQMGPVVPGVIPAGPGGCMHADWGASTMGAMMKKCVVCKKMVMAHGYNCRRCGEASHAKCIGLDIKEPKPV